MAKQIVPKRTKNGELKYTYNFRYLQWNPPIHHKIIGGASAVHTNYSLNRILWTVRISYSELLDLCWSVIWNALLNEINQQKTTWLKEQNALATEFSVFQFVPQYGQYIFVFRNCILTFLLQKKSFLFCSDLYILFSLYCCRLFFSSFFVCSFVW